MMTVNMVLLMKNSHQLATNIIEAVFERRIGKAFAGENENAHFKTLQIWNRKYNKVRWKKKNSKDEYKKKTEKGQNLTIQKVQQISRDRNVCWNIVKVFFQNENFRVV